MAHVNVLQEQPIDLFQHPLMLLVFPERLDTQVLLTISRQWGSPFKGQLLETIKAERFEKDSALLVQHSGKAAIYLPLNGSLVTGTKTTLAALELGFRLAKELLGLSTLRLVYPSHTSLRKLMEMIHESNSNLTIELVREKVMFALN